MSDRGRADLLEALHRELLEQELRLKRLIEQQLEGERLHERSSSAEQQARFARPGDPISLTERERQILQLVIRGRTNRQIGAELGCASGTIRNRLSRIYWKLGVLTRTHAAVRAIEMGLFRAGPAGGA